MIIRFAVIGRLHDPEAVPSVQKGCVEETVASLLRSLNNLSEPFGLSD